MKMSEIDFRLNVEHPSIHIQKGAGELGGQRRDDLHTNLLERRRPASRSETLLVAEQMAFDVVAHR